MLETRNLMKIYKPKKGVPVKALNNVTLKFPDKGMVFLLGKSGSGKSTLLNVLGGLDRCNSGEILIKGRSSRTFRQQHFDSYRNTYVGFIFQEYNILDEFSVGANIALALQLQGIKPTNEQINHILREVDLEGYGNRKPNELSGGQKQRVAIARALVKSPRIIMADEPTGALDSATGRQILSTLKKLSSDKLVIVVSHDREFAEQYADRIIELADGSVIRDVERCAQELPPEKTAPVYDADSVSLPQGYQLTQEDSAAICAYIQEMISAGKPPKFEILGGTGRAHFLPTDQDRIQVSQDGYHPIKSRLPMKYAFKMGASGLKHKKFRLVMTILLSCIAFILFGLADTMASYDYVTTCTSSLSDPQSKVTYAAFEKQQGFRPNPDTEYTYWDYACLTAEDYTLIREQAGITAYPVYSAAGNRNLGLQMDMSFYDHIPQEDAPPSFRYSSYYPSGFAGYVEVSDTLLTELGAELVAGSLPVAGSDGLVISTFLLQTFQEFGYTADGITAETIEGPQDILGKTLILDDIPYTVCGVVDTGIDYSRYAFLKEELSEDSEFVDQLLWLTMEQELRYALNYSLTGLAMVAPGQIERIAETLSSERDYYSYFYLANERYDFQMWADYGTLSQVDTGSIVWLDGTERTALADNEVVLSEELYAAAIQTGSYDSALDFTAQYESGTPDYSRILDLKLELFIYPSGSWIQEPRENIRIVGIIPTALSGEAGLSHIVSDAVVSAANIPEGAMICQTIAAMPESAAGIRKLVEFTDVEFTLPGGEPCCFNLMNPVSFELKALDQVFEVLRKVFVVVGAVFVVFASLLFSNFIATSISYKKREIGILRAIGSRSNDVFRIFFAESFLISMINFILSLAGTAGICAVINYYLRYQAGLLLTLLNVGLRQIGLLFGICVIVAVAASFLPVRAIAAKRPIDAIRDR